MLQRRDRYILLNLIPDVGSIRLHRLCEAFGSLEALWAADAAALQQVQGIGPVLAGRLAAALQQTGRLEQELALAERSGVRIVTLADTDYPAILRTIPDPPLALYVHGTLTADDASAIALVGSRGASLYGLQCADRLGYELGLRGVTVVSGLARGIDAEAHRGALKAGGRTLAVLGSGLARVYPPEHAGLAQAIARQGAVLSEFPMTMEPLPQHFPQRNRIISGLSRGVVVVEAAPKSGALITADAALEQGRAVFAVPGPMTSVTSQGAHALLKQGARLVTSVDDILEELGMSAPIVAETAPRSGQELSARVLACLGRQEPADIDRIATDSGLGAAEVSSLLLELELSRKVRQLPGKRFVRAPEEWT